MRVFIGIDFPKEVREEIRKIQERLPEFKGKKTELENIHLTLKFLGEIDERLVERVKEKLKDIKFESFEFKVNKIGVFSEKFVRIVWLGIDETDRESKKLWELQQKIDSQLEGFFEKEKRFMGHITIARVKNIKNKREFLDALKKINIDLKVFVDCFKLKQSILTKEKPVYSDLLKVELLKNNKS